MFLTKTYRGRNNSRTPYESAAVRLLFDGSVLARNLAAALAALLHVFGLDGNLATLCHGIAPCAVLYRKEAKIMAPTGIPVLEPPHRLRVQV